MQRQPRHRGAGDGGPDVVSQSSNGVVSSTSSSDAWIASDKMIGVVTARAQHTCEEEDNDVKRWLTRRGGGGGGGGTLSQCRDVMVGGTRTARGGNLPQSSPSTPYLYILTLGWAFTV